MHVLYFESSAKVKGNTEEKEKTKQLGEFQTCYFL